MITGLASWKATMAANEVIIYRGFRLNVFQRADGWKVALYKADGLVRKPAVPSALVFADPDACIAEAKSIIDAYFGTMSLLKDWAC
jgi:hypothetical protein